eukprot:TRINITY_DN7074_c0_g1_i2.p1 TRINITY_DN7074_c0_g1~~TRINITY_DN7074_c0_g1_i2.p1  ORF type:complete len:833 (+),score=208.66 TRINITY_DN7074_c0_g1_i2:91-2589(+)
MITSSQLPLWILWATIGVSFVYLFRKNRIEREREDEPIILAQDQSNPSPIEEVAADETETVIDRRAKILAMPLVKSSIVEEIVHTSMDGYEQQIEELSHVGKTPKSPKRNTEDLYRLYYEDSDASPAAGYLYKLNEQENQTAAYSGVSDPEPMDRFMDLRMSDSVPHEESDEESEEVRQDWNNRFQKSLHLIRSFDQFTPLSERIQTNLDLLHLSRDFIFTAQMYGKIIISETELPADQKTIRPIRTHGMLGGEKYVVQGILFKFAVDRNGLFGGDHSAAKVAGHELKGAISYLNCGVSGLNVPLMCLVDYRGYRLIAMSVLPISDDTIIYGSCDAGKTVHAKDSNFNRMMWKASSKLNIKPHRVGHEILFSPADLEGHRSYDGKYYLLDFSRVFPPEAPIRTIKNAHLSRLLRPEFIKNYSQPLCSDAFAGFIKGFHEDANREVIEATDHLIRTLIPKFANGELRKETQEAKEAGRLDDFRLTETIHRNGINCRYLGLVRKHTEDPESRIMILVNIVARVLKNNLRQKLRKKMTTLKKPLEEPYRRLVIKFLNVVFANTETSETYWRTSLKTDIRKNFLLALTNEESEIDYPLKPRLPSGEIDANFLSCVLRRFEKLVGMRLSPRTQNPEVFFTQTPFFDTDLDTLPLRVKHMNIINFAEGFFFEFEGLTHRVDDPISAQRFYQMAIDKFGEALDSNPNNKDLLLNVALTWTLALEIAEGNTFPAENGAVLRAMEYYLRAISAPPRYDSHSLFLYAYFLERCGKYETAEDYYLLSLEADPNNPACLLQYGNFLSERQKHVEAEKFFVRSSVNTQGRTTFEWNYWGSPNYND